MNQEPQDPKSGSDYFFDDSTSTPADAAAGRASADGNNADDAAIEHAVRLFLRYRRDPNGESEQDFLARHDAYRPLLVSLIRGDREGVLRQQSTAQLPDRKEAELRRVGSRPERLGPYRLRRVLGEGGMGTVFLAEQREPVRRQVALKVIRPGRGSAQGIARFEAERQALALMNHVNIAKVYEAGTTDEDEPYLAMEYVAGVPLTEYADNHRLSIEERLRLFMQVCQGVQHAHQKAIIHRDLTPGNVLVTEEDGAAVPKIIDFGLVKALDQDLTEKALVTSLGLVMGTPAYMSPEQAGRKAREIDIRTDVYSLGVILYELLVGVVPFDLEETTPAAYHEYLRKIREWDPPAPSVRLGHASQATGIAAQRATSTVELRRVLERDLNWITLKSLEKDPARRYASAAELAADVRRYLEHEPVLASPPTTTYRLRKFLRKHRGPVFATSTIIVALIVGLGFSLYFLKEAKQSEEDAIESAKWAKNREEEAKKQTAKANEAAKEAERQKGLAVTAAEEAKTQKVKAVEAAEEAKTQKTNAEKAAEEAEAQRKIAKTNEGIATEERDKALAAKEALAAEQARQQDLFDLGLARLYLQEEDRLGPASPNNLSNIDEWLAGARRLLDRRARHAERLVELDVEIAVAAGSVDGEPVGAGAKEGERSDQSGEDRRQELREHLQRLVELEVAYARVEKWAQSARSVASMTLEGDAAAAWVRVIDDLRRDPRYRGLQWQRGLVPLKKNGGYWEFWHVQSGERPEWDETRRTWRLAPETGIVMVLLPGGPFDMGAEGPAPWRWTGSPNTDLAARDVEGPVHRVKLGPFYISKYELTQAQWRRLTGKNPSTFGPDFVSGGVVHSELHPVESVTWSQCETALDRIGLELPTEAQWEYAARAGGGTPWCHFASDGHLHEVANLADQSARVAGALWHDPRMWHLGTDGFVAHAPVGTLKPNAFGIHDMHGNVWEWCRDWFGSYDNLVLKGSGERVVEAGIGLERVTRGGCFSSVASGVRSSHRGKNAPTVANRVLGVRPALTPASTHK